MAGSFAAGWLVALLLAVAPFVPAEVPRVTGALLCGYALGWAMLAALSMRFTDQPQRWAWALAAFMAAGGVLLLSFGSSVMGALAWVWPPVLLVLVVWAWGRAPAAPAQPQPAAAGLPAADGAGVGVGRWRLPGAWCAS